jgi:hypothetical protein
MGHESEKERVGSKDGELGRDVLTVRLGSKVDLCADTSVREDLEDERVRDAPVDEMHLAHAASE